MPQDHSDPQSVNNLIAGESLSWQVFVDDLALLPSTPYAQLAEGFGRALSRLALDEELRPGFSGVPQALSSLLKDNPRLLADPGSWLRPLLSGLLVQSLGWYPGSKESRDFSQALDQFVVHLADGETAAQPLRQLLEKQQERSSMLEARCRDSELGMAKIQQAQIQVLELLNRLVDVQLPEASCQFLRTTLRGELQFVLINQGEQAPAWQSWIAVVQRLPQIFPLVSATEEPPNRQQLYRDVQILVGLLDEHVTVSASQQQAYDQGVEELREHLFERLRGQSVPLVVFTPLENRDSLSRAGVSLSPVVSKQAAGLKPGQWFLFSPEEGQWLRCKLLLCPPDYVDLFFVNRNGQRVLVKTPQEFSACLATGLARPLAVEGVYEWLLAQTLEPLWQQVQVARAALAELPAETGIRVDIAPECTSESVAETGAEDSPAVNHKSAAEKAIQEARVLARLQQRREQRNASVVDSVPETEAARTALASDWVDGLNIGALLDITLATDVQRCKLVAIMRANEFYIFTNRQGVKVAEMDRTSLVTMLASGTAHIHSGGDSFEGQLSKVVKTLRREH